MMIHDQVRACYPYLDPARRPSFRGSKFLSSAPKPPQNVRGNGDNSRGPVSTHSLEVQNECSLTTGSSTLDDHRRDSDTLTTSPEVQERIRSLQAWIEPLRHPQNTSVPHAASKHSTPSLFPSSSASSANHLLETHAADWSSLEATSSALVQMPNSEHSTFLLSFQTSVNDTPTQVWILYAALTVLRSLKLPRAPPNLRQIPTAFFKPLERVWLSFPHPSFDSSSGSPGTSSVSSSFPSTPSRVFPVARTIIPSTPFIPMSPLISDSRRAISTPQKPRTASGPPLTSSPLSPSSSPLPLGSPAIEDLNTTLIFVSGAIQGCLLTLILDGD